MKFLLRELNDENEISTLIVDEDDIATIRPKKTNLSTGWAEVSEIRIHGEDKPTRVVESPQWFLGFFIDREQFGDDEVYAFPGMVEKMFPELADGVGFGGAKPSTPAWDELASLAEPESAQTAPAPTGLIGIQSPSREIPFKE